MQLARRRPVHCGTAGITPPGPVRRPRPAVRTGRRTPQQRVLAMRVMRVRAWWSRAARRGLAGALAAAMVVALMAAPVSAAGGDGEAADENGAPGPAGGPGLADAPSAPAAGGRSQDESDGPPDVDFGVDRGWFTEGICAVGDTLWVALRSRSRLQAYDRSTGGRDEAGDLVVEDPARGVWCDGETLWYTSKEDHSTIFAYDMATGTRQEDREFDIGGLSFNASSGGKRWEGPLGIASDGDTMWVASDSQDAGHRLYALDMSTKARKPEAEIALGGFYPRGLFSDGEFLWVASTVESTVRAYDIATLARVESLELDVSPSGSWGLWSDGDHMWVCNFRYTTVRAYPMPEAYGPRLETLEVSGVKLARLPSRAFRGHVARGTASVTVTAVAGDDAHTVTFGTADADGGVEGHQWSLVLGDNTLEVTVSDGTGSRVYMITVVRVDVDALSDDATLSSLSVDGAEVDGFAPDVLGYRLRVDNDAASATVAAAATDTAAQVTITPADTEPGTAGHQVALDVGSNVVTVTVAATDGLAEAAYTLEISRKPPVFGYDEFMDISGLEHRRSMDVWADARTRWVSYDRSGDEAVLAYDRSTGERTPGLDVTAPADGNDNPQALWSDGAVLYVLDTWKSMVFHYSLADDAAGFGAHAGTVSLEGIGRDRARGLWSDGEHMWVASAHDVKLYAYQLDGGARQPDEDFDTLRAAGNSMPVDLWSDGQVMWVLDKGGLKIYAYDLDSKQRLEYLDFETLERRNGWPSGLWSDGQHMWVSDADDTRAYAYVMPSVLGLGTLEVSGVELVRSSSTEYRGRVARGVATVTVTAAPADSAHAVTFGTADADGNAEGYQWSLALGDNTREITVSDGADSRTYTVVVVKLDVDALSDDATLSSLTVDGAAVEGFAADVHGYRLKVDHHVVSATVAATATETAAQVTISPADADPDTVGHQVVLDVGPNVVTVAVAATDGIAEAAYTLTISRRGDPDQPPDVDFGVDRGWFTEGICAVGDTLWVALRSRSRLQAYDRSTGGRDEAGDLVVEDPARGVWCDGETLWYTSKEDHSTIFAYDMATGTRQEDREFDIGGLSFNASSGGKRWEGPLGIASDGDTMWVASDSQDAGHRLYALDMSTKARKPEAEIALGGFYPRGLFSDGEFLWVASTVESTVRAYDIATLARVESLELDVSPSGSWGLWSDGDHMWVCNFRYTTVRAYPMPEAYGPRLETLEVSGVKLARLPSRAFRGHVARGTASVTVTAVAGDDAHTVTFGTADADGGVEGHQWSLVLGDNTLEVTVSDGTGSRVYMITVVRVDVDALSDDATLSSLSVDGAEVDGFAPDVLGYRLRVDNDAASATVAAAATDTAAQVTISPADADPGTAGHQVALGEGPNVVTVTVAATDGLAEAAYTLTISHPYSPFAPMGPFDVDGFGKTGRRLAFLWSNGATIWVSEPKEDSIEAYDLAGGRRQGDNVIDTLENAGNEWARGIWSDGDTIWVADFEDDKLYAYALDGGARRPDLDFDTLEAAGNTDPRGIWSDGDTMWVVDAGDNKLYAYALDGGARRTGLEIETLEAAGNTDPRDVWSDGDTIWVADRDDAKLYAYALDGGARQPDLDFDTLEAAGNTNPRGIWSDGDTMWVADPGDDKLYAYKMPPAQPDTQQGQGQQDDNQQTQQADQQGQAQQAQGQQDDPQQGVGQSVVPVPPGVCGRTAEVRDAILAMIGAGDCASVTHEDLAGVTDWMWLEGRGLSVLGAGDFAGLSAMWLLALHDNELVSLPEAAFEDMGGLSMLFLNGNRLETLPAGVFRGLGRLGSLTLDGNPGAPFALVAQLQPAGESEVAVTVSEAAPFDMAVTLAAQGGTLSAHTVTIAGGVHTSDTVTVTAHTPGAAVTVTVESVQFSEGASTGLELAAGEPVVIGAPTPPAQEPPQQEPPQQEPPAQEPPAQEPPAQRPAPPAGLSTVVSPDLVTVSWGDPGDGTITGYVILRRDKDIHPEGTFDTLVPDTGSAATSYVDAGVDPERRYVYRIKAVNAAGASDRSTWVRAYTPAAQPAPGRPAPPAGLSTVVSPDSVTLTWGDPGDRTITGYVILRRDKDIHPEGIFRTITADTGTAAATYTDNTAQPGRRYVYRIKAVNAHGFSDISSWVRAYTPTAP